MIRYLKFFCDRTVEFFYFHNFRQTKIEKLDFYREILPRQEYVPIFFLSTGRTGTKFFSLLMSKSKKVIVNHAPSQLFYFTQAELIQQGRAAYEIYMQKGFDDENINKLVSQIFLAAREDFLYKSYLHKKVYIETNNRITFLAPGLKYLFPKAKFVHLYRHPGEFIRSGIRRKYYDPSNKNEHELGRLLPLKGTKYYNLWNSFDYIQRVAWLWNETNLFVEKFLETLDSTQYRQLNFNNLTVKKVKNILEFLDINEIDEEAIEKAIKKPVNVQKRGSFPHYRDWSKEDKDKVREICGDLAKKYGYEL